MANVLKSRWKSGMLTLSPSTVIGTEFHVDATNGASTNSGLTWADALDTWDAAIDLCTADKGDVIYMAPWHAEDVADAATIVLDTDGITSIGLIQGNQRPTISLGTDAAATITVTGANNRISGIKVVSALADVAAGITASAAADGLIVDHCIFSDGDTDEELVIGVLLAAACDGCKIVDNEFYSGAYDDASAISLAGESIRTIIARNIIQGDYSAAAIDGATAASTLITVADNDIMNIDTTAGGAFVVHANTTGFIVRNTFMGGHSIANAYIGAKCYVNFNYSTGAVGASGILAEPAADTE